VSDNKIYANKSAFWDLADQSNANFLADPGTYPTKYTYFCQQMAQAHLTGTSAFGYTCSFSVSTLLSGTWPAIYTIAKTGDA
jgi:hypothetical protein